MQKRSKYSLYFLAFSFSLANTFISVCPSPAYAAPAYATEAEEGPEARPPHLEMTPAQEKCFTDNGLPSPGLNQKPHERPSEEVRQKVGNCLKANGFKGPMGHHRPMTDAQKKCFTDNGLPPPGQDHKPHERPSEAVWKKVHACLETNGFKGRLGRGHGHHHDPEDDPSSDDGH